MIINFLCPHCRGQLNAQANQAGQTLECPLCHKNMVVNGPSQISGAKAFLNFLIAILIIGVVGGFIYHVMSPTQKPPPAPRVKDASDILRDQQIAAGIPKNLLNSLWDGSVPAVEDYLRGKYAEFKVLKWRPTVVKDGKCLALCDVSVKNKLGGWSNYGMVFAATMSGKIIEVVPMPLN